jgi:hypothetical protein
MKLKDDSMRTLFTLAAAALALSVTAGAAFADPNDDRGDNNGFPTVTTQTAPDTTFDLGIDVSDVANTPSSVRAFLGSLEPVTRGVIETTCNHYMENPQAVRTQDTLAFCSVVAGG